MGKAVMTAEVEAIPNQVINVCCEWPLFPVDTKTVASELRVLMMMMMTDSGQFVPDH